MTTFDDRENAFENKFAHDEEMKFRAEARRNKLLGLWAADLMGKSGAEADAYAKEVVKADFEEAGGEFFILGELDEVEFVSEADEEVRRVADAVAENRSYARRIGDVDDRTGIVRLVLDKSSTLFSEPATGRLRHGGARHIMSQPEFQQPEELRQLIALLEDENYVVHLLEDESIIPVRSAGEASVSIGHEHHDEKLSSLSLVTARYQLAGTVGTIGVLGPMRMDYPHVVALVEGLASLLSRSAA